MADWRREFENPVCGESLDGATVRRFSLPGCDDSDAGMGEREFGTEMLSKGRAERAGEVDARCAAAADGSARVVESAAGDDVDELPRA